ncbi:hypothetical protein COOONC_26326 [Cooperia oncophora]
MRGWPCRNIISVSSSHQGYAMRTVGIRDEILVESANKDRLECTSTLLEEYHEYLKSNTPEDCPVTLDSVRKAYDSYVPVAMVTSVVSMKNKEDIEPLIDRAKGLIENVYTMTKLLEK